MDGGAEVLAAARDVVQPHEEKEEEARKEEQDEPHTHDKREGKEQRIMHANGIRNEELKQAGNSDTDDKEKEEEKEEEKCIAQGDHLHEKEQEQQGGEPEPEPDAVDELLSCKIRDALERLTRREVTMTRDEKKKSISVDDESRGVALKRHVLALQCMGRNAPLPRTLREVVHARPRRGHVQEEKRGGGGSSELGHAIEAYHARRSRELKAIDVQKVPHEKRVQTEILKRAHSLAAMQAKLRLAMRAEAARMHLNTNDDDDGDRKEENEEIDEQEQQQRVRCRQRYERGGQSASATEILIDWRRFSVGGGADVMKAGELRFLRAMQVVQQRITAAATAATATTTAVRTKAGASGAGSGNQAPPPPSGPTPAQLAAAAEKEKKQAEMKRIAEERRAAAAAAKAAQEQRQAEARRQMELRIAKERERKMAKERRKRFHNSIYDALKEMRAQERSRRSVRRLRNDFVMRWHEKLERNTRRNEEMRIRALKNSDHEAYARMVQESKNERLRMLMSKTNDIVAQLSEKVRVQKEAEEKEAADADASDDEDDAERKDEESDGGSEPKGSAKKKKWKKKRKMVTKHKSASGDENVRSANNNDDVIEQPSLLVGVELRPYQMAGLRWMAGLYANKMNGILADEMGLGKTVQTISLIAYLMETRNVYGPHLILAPKATLSNWHNEMQRWCPDLDVVHYDGKPEERRLLREGPIREGTFNVLLTHYDLAMSDKFALKKVAWSYLIVDEGHRMKNHKSKLAELLQREYSFRYRLLLTGTPIQNNLMELWSLLNFILPHIFNSQQSFAEWFNAPFAGAKEDVVLNDEEQHLIILRLHSVLRPFLLRRTKKEVELDLPDKRSGIIKCGLSAWQRLYYTNVVENKRIGSRSLNNRVMQLRKVCNHPYLFGGVTIPEMDDDIEMVSEETAYARRLEEITRASGKLALLASVLRKMRRTGHRVLVFSQQTKALDVIQDYLEMVGYGHLRLDGSNKGDERSEMITRFNAPDSDVFVFLLSTRAGGLGLNLQTADTVIIYDSDWNPQADAQAEARAHRIGQKQEVRVLVLVSAGTIEERILERAQQKRQIDEQVIQAGMFNSNWSEEDRSKVLEEALQRQSLVDLGGGVTSNGEVNRIIARSDEELEIFDAMDEEFEAPDPGRIRLMAENEIPAYVLREEEYIQNAASRREEEARRHEEEGRHARGARKKKVVYADVFTDDQFTQLVEEGADLQAEQERLYDKKKRRRSKAAARKAAAGSASASAKAAAEAPPPRQPPRKKAKKQAAQKAATKTPKLLASEINGAADKDPTNGAEPPESSLEL